MVARPDSGATLCLVAGVVDECRELTPRDGMTADGQRLRDRHLVPRAFGIRALWLCIRRSHREAAGWHDHHIRAMLVILEPLALAGARFEPTVRRTVIGGFQAGEGKGEKVDGGCEA